METRQNLKVRICNKLVINFKILHLCTCKGEVLRLGLEFPLAELGMLDLALLFMAWLGRDVFLTTGMLDLTPEPATGIPERFEPNIVVTIN